jgi:hypothetical protein
VALDGETVDLVWRAFWPHPAGEQRIRALLGRECRLASYGPRATETQEDGI